MWNSRPLGKGLLQENKGVRTKQKEMGEEKDKLEVLNVDVQSLVRS